MPIDDGPWAVTPLRNAQPWWRPFVAGAAIAALALALMVWQVVVRGPFIAADWHVHELLEPHVPEGTGKTLLNVLSRPGQRWLTVPILLAAGAFVAWRQRRPQPVIAVLVGLGAAYLVGKAVKDGLGRTPPYRDIDILHGVGEAFPSGHAANAALTWALLAVLLFGRRGLRPDPRLLRRGLLAAALLAAVVGAIMVVMDYHWLSDIVGGWTVGLLVLMLTMLALGPPTSREESADDERGRDGGQTLAAAGETEPISGGPEHRDGRARRGGESGLGLGPP